jgi:hypothetical protein
MLLKWIVIICKMEAIRKDGLCNIYIQYCYSAKKRTLLNSGIAIPPHFGILKNQKFPIVYQQKLETLQK